MDVDADRIPALHLTLDHYLPLAGGDWIRVTGLALDGSDVIVAAGRDSHVRLPGSRLVFARLARAVADPYERQGVQRRLAG